LGDRAKKTLFTKYELQRGERRIERIQEVAENAGFDIEVNPASEKGLPKI